MFRTPHAINHDLLELGIAIQTELVLDHTSCNLARHLPLRHFMLGQMVSSEMAAVNIGVEVILIGLGGFDGIDRTGLGVKDLVVVLDRGKINHDCNWGNGTGIEVERGERRKLEEQERQKSVSRSVRSLG